MVNILKALRIPCFVLPDYRAYIIIVLSSLMFYNLITSAGSYLIFIQFISAISVAFILDAIITRFLSKKWIFPGGAIISAMIIALIINPGEILITSAVVIISLILKYLIRPKFRNLFNPAVLAITLSTLILPVYSAWHGSTGIIVFILGLILVFLIKRASVALSFLIVYFLLDSVNAFLNQTLQLNFYMLTGPIIFFAFIMIIEPVTTPNTTQAKIIFGSSVAVLSFILSFSGYLFGNSFFLYLSLLFMNLILRVIPRRILQ